MRIAQGVTLSAPWCTVTAVTADEIVANLDRVLPEQERVLAQAARNAEIGIKGNSAVYRAFTDLDFFALTVDFDLRVLLRNLLAHPQSRLTAEKFLVLALEEADESVDNMINRLLGAIRRAGSDDPAHDAFDFEIVRVAKVEFDDAMAPMRADTDFTQTLRLIRNTVSAHVVGDDVGIQNGVIWVLTRENVPRNAEGVMRSQVVYYATSTLSALNGLSRALRRAVKAAGDD
ncbi:hypothetical protein DEU36_2391 [Microbacterium sp. AG238]|nr:hypothetical protein DEU36_2391 [Microbacterium sp. AG238]